MPQQEQAAVKPKFKCNACGERYTWKPQIAGRQAKCKCGAILLVPAKNPLGNKPPPPAPAPQPDPVVVEEEVPSFDEYDVAAPEENFDAEPDAAPPPPPPSRTNIAKKGLAAAAASKEKQAASSGGLVGAVNSFIPDNDNWKWWYYVIAGFLMVPVSIWQYMRLTDYESGESATIGLKSFERMLYGIFGKWGVCGFLVLLGAICIFIGYAKFMGSRGKSA